MASSIRPKSTRHKPRNCSELPISAEQTKQVKKIKEQCEESSSNQPKDSNARKRWATPWGDLAAAAHPRTERDSLELDSNRSGGMTWHGVPSSLMRTCINLATS